MPFGQLGTLGVLGLGMIGTSGPRIALSASGLPENSAEGTAIGTLSVIGATGTPVFTLVDSSPANKVKLAGVNNVSAQAGSSASDYEATPTVQFTVSVSGVTPAIANTTFTVTVTNVVEDTTPTAFSFTDVTDAATSTVYESNTITVAGMDGPADVTITGGEYSKNGGAWASSATTAVVGDTFKVRGTSSSSASTAVNVALTIGGVSDTYTITTAASGGGSFPDNSTGASEYQLLFAA